MDIVVTNIYTGQVPLQSPNQQSQNSKTTILYSLAEFLINKYRISYLLSLLLPNFIQLVYFTRS